MVYNVTDGYTFCCENVLPIEYENVEKVKCDFISTWEETKNKKDKNIYCRSDFTFLGRLFDYNDFKDYATTNINIKFKEPNFYTLEDWWEKNIQR